MADRDRGCCRAGHNVVLSVMTAAQNEAIAKMHQLLCEHFDAGIIIITADDELRQMEEPQMRFHGGVFRCMGLNQAANLYLTQGLHGQITRGKPT